MSDAAYELTGVSFTYPGVGLPAVHDLSLRAERRAVTAIIGPNGAGKSTVVRLLGGALRPSRGSVRFLGRELAEWDRGALSRRVAVLSQEAPPGVPLSVREYVELGRSPYVGPWSSLGPRDREVVEAALARTDLVSLQERALTELSGGERQRAKLARALAQEPEVLVLDEPTAFLDLGHALWTFEALADLVRDDGVSALCVTHDVNLASRFASTLALMAEGRLIAQGAPTDVLASDALGEAYGCDIRVERRAGLGHFVLPVRVRAPADAPSR
ncbi:MAG: ABC transporter ATP-binding protein [Gemmatimonadetes bacterium]|nr:ABC transporter ATP-binding protein [Gemmatimonadota bacterium]